MNFTKNILSLLVFAGFAACTTASIAQQQPQKATITAGSSLAQPQAVARFLHNGKTFEKIFFNNFIEETKKQKANTSLSTTNVQYSQALSSIQLQQVAQIGVADVVLIPLSGFETNARNNPINLIDYPFMFSDWAQVQRSFFPLSHMLGNQLIAGGVNSSPVAVVPASFRVIASNNPNNYLEQDISVENSPTALATFTSFKNSNNVKPYAYGQTPSTPTIDISILDLYDQKLYQKYRYIYLTQHSLQSYVLFVSNRWWATLTTEQQEVLKGIFGKTAEKTLADTIRYNNEIIAALQKTKGIVFGNVDTKQLKASLGKIHSSAPAEIKTFYDSIK